MGNFAELLDRDELNYNRNVFSSLNIYKFEAVTRTFCFPPGIVFAVSVGGSGTAVRGKIPPSPLQIAPCASVVSKLVLWSYSAQLPTSARPV